jgi:hypothetical protein
MESNFLNVRGAVAYLILLTVDLNATGGGGGSADY